MPVLGLRILVCAGLAPAAAGFVVAPSSLRTASHSHPALSLRGGSPAKAWRLSSRRLPATAAMSMPAAESATWPGPAAVATAYAVAGVASAVAWLVVSYVALSVHPVASINAACGIRHNALTIAQAWALPLPLGWAVFSALHSAATVGWDRLRSATYRRLNLGLAFASLWLAAATAFGPTFSVGYKLFTPPIAYGAASVHALTGHNLQKSRLATILQPVSLSRHLTSAILWAAMLAMAVWARSVGGNYLTRLVRGVVGSIFLLAPLSPSDDPDSSKSDVGSVPLSTHLHLP